MSGATSRSEVGSGGFAAIPLVLCHSLLQTKTLEIVDSLEMAGAKFLNLLGDRKAVAAQTRAGDKVQ